MVDHYFLMYHIGYHLMTDDTSYLSSYLILLVMKEMTMMWGKRYEMLGKIMNVWMVAADYLHPFHEFLDMDLCSFLSYTFGFCDNIPVHNDYDFGTCFYVDCDEMRDVRLAASILSERGG